MAKREGLFDHFVAIAAKFPWWLGVLMAGGSYSGLHYAAISSIAAPTTVAAIGSAVTSQLVKTAADIGQYIVPIVFLAGRCVDIGQTQTKRDTWTRCGAGPASDRDHELARVRDADRRGIPTSRLSCA